MSNCSHDGEERRPSMSMGDYDRSVNRNNVNKKAYISNFRPNSKRFSIGKEENAVTAK